MSDTGLHHPRTVRRWLSVLWSFILLCIIATLTFLIYFGALREYTSEAWIQAMILHLETVASGEWAVFAFLLVCTVRPITLFPSSILALVAGALWGLLHGTIIALVGSVAGATVAFWLARRTGHRFIRRLVGPGADQDLGKRRKYGFGLVFWTRLLPVFPFDVVNYGAGFSRMHYHHYLVATTFGLIPSTFLYIYIGNALRGRDFAAAVGCGLLLLLISLLVFFGPHKRSRARLSTQDG